MATANPPSWSTGSRDTIRPNGKWSDERVIIFTEYRATQNWLQTILATEGFTGNDRLMTMFGGMDSEKREAVKAAFQTDPDKSPSAFCWQPMPLREGLDLQNFCSPPHPLRNSLEPQPHGTAEWPY